MKQFIVEDVFAPTPEISLSGRAYNYLIRVRRHRNGDCIELAFPNGEKLAYTIVENRYACELLKNSTSPKTQLAEHLPFAKAKLPHYRYLLRAKYQVAHPLNLFVQYSSIAP